MDFAALPPEINSAKMYSGPGVGPMTAAATAWNAVAAELNSTAGSYRTVLTRLTSEEWQGSASTSMAEAAAPYLAWMSTTGAQAELVANRAMAAAAAYEQAFAMTVPPAEIGVNRTQLQQLVATNVLGQNTPAIAATEAQYGEMWAQDAVAMYGYAGHSAAATRIKQFTSPPQTANPAGAAAQATAASHAAASKTLASTSKALQALATPVAMTSPTTPAASAPTTLSSLCGIFKSPMLSAANSTYSNAIHSANFGARGICALWRGMGSSMGAAKAAQAGAKAAAAAAKAAGGAAKTAGSLGTVHVTGGFGHAGSIGALSVPRSWAPAAPVAMTGPVSGGTWEPVGGVHEVAAHGAPGMPGVPAGAGVSGRGAGFGALPRYGARLTVMPRPPVGG